jgi:siroheme decarboxylase
MKLRAEGLLPKLPYDFPVMEQPYQEIARQLNVGEEELIGMLQTLKDKGIVRRIAAVMYHRKAAYTHNAMVVWKVDDKDVERVGKVFASFSEVSHCYERENGSYWGYNIYTMVHARSQASCEDTVQRMAERTGIKDYKIFFSKREFKKTSLKVKHD